MQFAFSLQLALNALNYRYFIV